MAHPYTFQSLKSDILYGITNGVVFTAGYSGYRVYTDSSTLNTGSDLASKAKYGSRVFMSKLPKFGSLFIGTYVAQSYAKSQGFSQLNSMLIAVVVGVGILSIVRY